MKKLLMTAVLLASVVGASAQITAETIMGMLPKLPTEAEMIRYQKETSAPQFMEMKVTQPDLYNDFADAMNDAEEKVKEGVEQLGNSLKAKMMGSKAAGTEFSVEQVASMSEDELQSLAQDKLSSTLGGLGLSAGDIAKLQGGNVSDAEAQAMASKILQKKLGGMSMQDLQKLEKMGEKEAMEYMQKSGMAQRLGAQMAQDKPKLDKSARISKLNIQLSELAPREKVILDKLLAMPNAATEEGQKLYDRNYKAKIDGYKATMKQAIQEGAFSEKYTKEDEPQVIAAGKKYQAAEEQAWQTMNEFYAQFIPQWRKMVFASMEVCKSEYLPLQKERKSIMDELYSITQDASYAMSDTYPPIAGSLYLEQAKNIGEYPTSFADDAEE